MKSCTFALVSAVVVWLIPAWLSLEPSGDLGAAPSLTHWLGTTPAGEDVLVLVTLGSRHLALQGAWCGILAIALGSVQVALELRFVGTLFERVLREFRGIVDAFGPALPLAAYASVFPKADGMVLVMVLAVLTVPSVAGPLRASIETAWMLPYVQASRMVGVGPWRLFRSTLLPEIQTTMAPWLGAFTAQAAAFLSALSFLGVGQSDQVALGTRLYDASGLLRSAPWYFVATATAIMAVFYAGIIGGNALRTPKPPTSA